MITSLRCEIDTLEATFDGEIDPIALLSIQNAKHRAQESGDPVPIMLGGQELYVSPKGGGLWSYSMRNSDLLVWLSSARNIPSMKVKLGAYPLAERGALAVWKDARELGEALGMSPLNCTRADVAADFQGWTPTFEEMRHIVCPASFRPVYPSADNPETFQIGKGDSVVRVYDKSKEIRVSKKLWWQLAWRRCHNYREGEPVWRAEVQVRGPVLRQLGLRSVEAVIENANGVFEYGMEWCSLRTPTADTNPSRWPVHPYWAHLIRTFMPGDPLTIVRPARTLLEYDAGVKRFLGLVASVGASIGSDDYWHVAEILSSDAKQHMEEELQTTFPDLVEKRRRRRHL
jgi:hypothetical protein